VATINEILDRFEREYVPHLAASTQKNYRYHIEVLRTEFGARNADELKPRDFGPFLDVATGKSHRNRSLAVLSCAMSEAVGRWYMAERNVLRDVKRNPTHRRERYVTDEEFAAFKASASARVGLAMELSLLTGQKQGAILGLLWTNVLPDGILFRRGRRGKLLMVKMSPAVAHVLSQCRALAPQGPNVLSTRAGTAYTGAGFRQNWQKAMDKALKGGVIAERFTFNDLRAKSVIDSKSVGTAHRRLGLHDLSTTQQLHDRDVRTAEPLR